MRTKLGDFNIFQFAFARNIYGRINESRHVNQFVSRRVVFFASIIVLNDIIMSTLTSVLSLIISRRYSIPTRLKSGNYTISSV